VPDFRAPASRRDLLRTLGVAVGVLFAGALTRVFGRRVEPRALPAPSDPGSTATRERAVRAEREVAELFGDIRPGTRVGDCEVVSLHAPIAGAIPVVMRTSGGRTFQVDVLRRDDARTVSSSATLAVSVCNGGDGLHATDEAQGLGAMALANALARREAEGARPPVLLTLRERAERFPTGVLRVRA